MNFPKMYHLRQMFDAPTVKGIEETLSRELASIQVSSLIRPGSRVAITAGSRGVAHMDVILAKVVRTVRELGGKPFLFPAMGSHGGGTAEGQIEVLKSLRITEETMGAPIISSMDVVEIGRNRFGFPVLVDKHAAAADGIVVVNRIKPHTDFEGPVGSGLMKMMAIGMGKHAGCSEVHKQTVNFGYREVIPEVGRIILEKLPVLFCIGIVENVYEETAMIRAMVAAHVEEGEMAMLAEAKRLMARLPFDRIDVLVVDEMGKNISGTGMDTNVIGRIMFIGEKEPERPRITRIVVLDLTPESHGNAVGIGLADYTTQRLLKKVDHGATATNAITAITPEKGRMPIALGTDRGAVEAALATIGAMEPENARVVHIRNTLELRELEISEALLDEAGGRENLRIIGQGGTLSFDEAGNIRRVSFAEP
jgi:hypothetical protein